MLSNQFLVCSFRGKNAHTEYVRMQCLELFRDSIYVILESHGGYKWSWQRTESPSWHPLLYFNASFQRFPWQQTFPNSPFKILAYHTLSSRVTRFLSHLPAKVRFVKKLKLLIRKQGEIGLEDMVSGSQRDAGKDPPWGAEDRARLSRLENRVVPGPAPRFGSLPI